MSRMQKSLIVFFLIILGMGFFVFLPRLAKAASDVGTISFPDTKITSIEDLIVTIINWLLGFVGALAVVAVVYSGIMYITSGGDPAKAEAAKKNLAWAIMGIIVVALALIIINTIVQVLGGTPPPST